jgi:uncharacterized membrane protein
MEFDPTLVRIHGIAGLAGLLLFWIQVLGRKGGGAHRLLGRLYTAAMATVCVTAAPMAVATAIAGQGEAALFLAYLTVITGSGLYQGWRATRAKAGLTALVTPVFRLWMVLNLVAGTATLATGIMLGQHLFTGFSLVGILGGLQMLGVARRAARAPRHEWLLEHIGSMMGTGIAAHVAFGALGVRRLFPGLPEGGLGLIGWFGPLVVGTVATALLLRHHRLRLTAPRPAREQGAPTATA